MPEKLTLAVCLFTKVTPLDFQGPMSLFGFIAPGAFPILPAEPAYNIEASYFAVTMDPVVTDAGPNLLPTRTYASVKPGEQFDLILVPGGTGTRLGVTDDAVIQFIKTQAPGSRNVLSVCTGSELLARAGVLDGLRATTNKFSYKHIKEQNPSVNWVPKARWVVDGKVWAASGVTAGTDMAYAFMQQLVGHEISNAIRGVVELVAHEEGDDEFAEFYGLV